MLCSNQAMLQSSNANDNISDKTVFIHSKIQSAKGVSERVIVEYTKLDVGNTIGKDSIISNNVFPPGVHVPDQSFLHTVTVRDGTKEPVYVTIAFGTEDNLKKCCQSRKDISSLKYAGMDFDEVLKKLKLNEVKRIFKFKAIDDAY